MAIAALALFISFLVLVGVARPLIQVRRTGDAGDRRKAARLNGTQRRIDGLAAAGALAVGVASPLAAIFGLGPAVATPALSVAGLVLAILGTLATFITQLAMGDSWRVGVDPSERTALVTSGPFGVVRNPILSAVMITFVGLALMVPTVFGLLGLVGVVIASELLVRLVEEPHLRQVHGEEYARYAAAVGRFVPGIGRLT